MSLLDNIHVTSWGSEGPRVVMVHGGAQGTASAGHKNFFKQEVLATEGWQLIVPDRPGHGESPAPGRPDDAEADGEWAAELLGDGAHLVGHSYGGLVALAALATRPEAVRSLVLVEPALLKIATKAPAVRKLLGSMAATMLLPYRPATKAKRAMKLLGIPDVFALDENDHDSLGRSLKAGKFPSKKTMNAWLALVRERRIPLLTISAGSNAAFDATCAIVAEKGGGRHEIVPMPHHFPQWSAEVFNPLVATVWREAEAR
jgi:pimeloyl-ACP methyl ester carboxylesterase